MRARFEQSLSELAANRRVVFGGVRRTGGAVGAILRIEETTFGFGGASFVVALIAPGPNGEPTVVDFELSEQGRTIVDHLATEYVDNLPQNGEPINNLRALARREIEATFENDSSAATIALYERKNFAALQIFRVDRVYLTALSDEAFYETQPEKTKELAQKIAATSERLKARAPNGVGVELSLANSHFAGVSREDALEAVARLRRVVGDDAYFDYIEGVLYVQSDPEKTLELFRKAGRKGLRSIDYLTNYYLWMKSRPDANEAATRKIYETGVAEHGEVFEREAAEIDAEY